MIAPDTIPAWFAIPTMLVLLIVWRRQVLADRRRASRVRVEPVPFPPVSARTVALTYERGEQESGR